MAAIRGAASIRINTVVYIFYIPTLLGKDYSVVVP